MELTIEYGSFPEWPKGTDCKSAAFASVVRIHQLPPIKPHELHVYAVLVFINGAASIHDKNRTY